jgi:hypothetical protein
VARAGVRAGILPDRFNPRNWGTLPKRPALIHYNNWDSENVEIKERSLQSFSTFLAHISASPNRFWMQYKHHFAQLADREAESLSEFLRATLSPHVRME